MNKLFPAENQIQFVTNFHDLISTPFHGVINAICWNRPLVGDFSEIINKFEADENITTIDEAALCEICLSEEGNLAREMLLGDMKFLEAHGASPILNIIKSYDRDEDNAVFPTDVYSFHVDRSPVPVDTFLCTYYGTTSEILPNALGEKKILIPEIRNELRRQYADEDSGFESYLSENFYDLHYKAKANAVPISLGLGHLCRIAIDHPEITVPPCLHRAPLEKAGQPRLLLIC
ncbi:MAG: hypothetical protein WAT92_07620 [Saprospiraceae bacterium]